MRSLGLWLPVIAYMAILFQLSSHPALPGSTLTPDWVQHAVAYAGLAAVTLRATSGGRWAGVTAASLAAAWLIATIYGASDELHQAFVPSRTADLRDLAADAAGAAAGLGAAWAWGIIRRSS
jgi:VanZ family protein